MCQPLSKMRMQTCKNLGGIFCQIWRMGLVGRDDEGTPNAILFIMQRINNNSILNKNDVPFAGREQLNVKLTIPEPYCDDPILGMFCHKGYTLVPCVLKHVNRVSNRPACVVL
jgi:hypothetical protein